MKNKVFRTFGEAVADIPNGSTVMFPGFAGVGHPRNLMAALLSQGAKHLTGISNGSGGRDDQVDVATLINARQFQKMIMAFTASPHPSNVTVFDEMYQSGKIEAELVPQGTLAERIRAAGSGIGAFYTRTGVGTELAEGKETRVIDGKEYLLEYPLHADYAFLRALRADEFGNLQFKLSQRNFNPIMGMAAKTTIVEVEEDILELGEIDPDNVHLSGIFVDRVVKIPADGIWDKINRR
ncbi:MAG: 3-oxoacid CoA-transferase subunit A [Chloroflexi bacterium]|nr:3-oxoacid CoA-transferase subunit A [Chloroflexota bacterium]